MKTIQKCIFICCLTLLMPLAANAATRLPPDISELDGATFNVKLSGTRYDLDSGVPVKIRYNVQWTLTVLDSNRLLIVSSEPSFDPVEAYYSAGVLVTGDLTDDDYSTQSLIGYALISGTPGKLKMKGEIQSYDLLSNNSADSGKLSGKQLMLSPAGYK